MPLKYFTLAVSAFLYLGGLYQANAQTRATTPALGYLRFWNMVPPVNGKFDLRKIGGSTAEAGLNSSATSYRESNYTALPPGRYRLGVFRAGDDKTPLKVIDLNLLANTFFTVLMSPGKIDLMNDTIDPKTSTGTVNIRNYFPGVTVTVALNGQDLATLPYGESYQATALPLVPSTFNLSGRLPDGKPVQSSVGPDFKTSKRATILIIPDSYGRFRPQVAVDGNGL